VNLITPPRWVDAKIIVNVCLIYYDEHVCLELHFVPIPFVNCKSIESPSSRITIRFTYNVIRAGVTLTSIGTLMIRQCDGRAFPFKAFNFITFYYIVL